MASGNIGPNTSTRTDRRAVEVVLVLQNTTSENMIKAVNPVFRQTYLRSYKPVQFFFIV